MTELAQKVITLLQENGIEKDQTLEIIAVIYKEIEYSMWESLKISPMILYGLKDIVWYNLEHLPQGGEDVGKSDLRFLGTKFPNFIYSFNDGDYMKLDDVKNFLIEAENISSHWNKYWRFANIYSTSKSSWQGGEKPSKVIIHEKNYSPQHYMEKASRASRIIGVDGNLIRHVAEDTIMCVLNDEIGEYGQGPIFYQQLLRIQEACRNAIRNNKDLRLELED